MSREVKRVPLEFDWPLYKIWQGYLMPDDLDEEKCLPCDGSGYSDYARALQSLWYGYLPFDPATTGSTPWAPETPAIWDRAERNAAHAPEYYGSSEAAIRREAGRLADLFNSQWSHHLHQDDVDALVAACRLYDFTHTWKKGDGWQPISPPPAVTAEQVNVWSLEGLAHDSINCSVVIRARCEREGRPLTCAACVGQGSTEKYDGQRAEAEAWERTHPPTGDGWQVWETTSEGSPISPVFGTAEELAAWMSNPDRTDRYAKDWVPYDSALRFIKAGWAPSMMGIPGHGIVNGVEAVGYTLADVDAEGEG